MRKFLFLCVLCLVLAASAAPTRKVKAGTGRACSAARIALIAAEAAYQAACADPNNTDQCQAAIDNYLDAEVMVQLSCYRPN
jgi:hypothetical protein